MPDITQQTLDDKIQGIKDAFRQAGFENACIGISGGKDSAVAAALLVRALGAEHVTAAIVPRGIMPDIQDARLVYQNLGLTPTYVDIWTYTSMLQNDIMRVTNTHLNDTIKEAHGNATARLRTCVIRYIAAAKNALVVGTTNLSEWFVGYFTKGGDDAVDIEPLIDLTCTEVIELGKLMPEIPTHILEKAPNDGLHGRTDEQRLGITYKQLDTYIREGTSGYTDIDQKISKLHEMTRHKRTLPICI